jgi:hypothetical protein
MRDPWKALRSKDIVSSASPPKTAALSPSRGLTHPRAGLSHAQWRALGPAEKIERLFSMSLDDLYAIMSWPIEELDPFRLSIRMQVTRVVFMVGVKAMLDGKLSREAARERDRERALGELIRGFEQSPE